MNSNDLTFTLRFNAENKQFIGQVKAAGGAVSGLGGNANATQKQLNTLTRETDKAGSGFDSLSKKVVSLAGGFSALLVAQNATDRLGQYQDIRTQITALVGGQEQWIETEKYLNRVSEDHNKTLIDMAGNYARLAVLQDAGILNQEEMRSIFEGMSNAQSQAGISAVQLGQSMYGLSQALSSPIVRAEELNQVVEPIPALLNKLDEAAGLQAGGFRKMMLSGEVTSDFFKTNLIKALAEYDGAAARTANNVNAKYAEFTRAYQDAVLAYESPISDSLSASVSASTTVLKLFAENAELITALVGVGMVTAFGRASAVTLKFTADKLQNIAASRAKTQANILEAQAQLVAVNAEIKHIEAMKASNVLGLVSARVSDQLAVATARRTALIDGMTAAQARLNTVTRIGTGLMATLGGPVGVIMAAVGALSYFALASVDAAESSKDLHTEMNTVITQYKDLNEVGKARFMQDLGKEAVDARMKLAQVRMDILTTRTALEADERSGSPLAISKRNQLRALEQEAKTLEAAVKNANDQYTALLTNSTSGNWTNPDKKPDEVDNSAAVKSGEKMLELLSRQAALYGQTSEVAKVRYEIENGSLKGINADLEKQLLLQARIIDGKRAEAEEEKAKTDKIDSFYETSDKLNARYLEQLAIQADYENKAKIQEQFAYASRQESLQATFDEAYAQAKDNQNLQMELERQYFLDRQVLRKDHELTLTEIAKKADDERKAYQYQTAMDTLSFTQQQLSITTDFLKNTGKEQSALYRTLFAIQKAAAIPSMIIATEEAADKALTLGPIAGPIASAAIRTMGYTSIGIVAGTAFSGQAHDGIDRVPASNEGTWLLKENEMVLNPKQADNFRWMVDATTGLREMFNSMKMSSSSNSSGSAQKPISVNYYGLSSNDVQTTTTETNEGITVDVVINEAVRRALAAVYQDIDNNGNIAKRISGLS